MADVADTGWWGALAPGFLACHRRRANVEAHLVTTPLGLFGAVWLVGGVSIGAAAASVAAYAVFLLARVPRAPAIASTAVMAGLLGAAWVAGPRPIAALGLIAIGWVGQELAHRLSGEPTFQGTYEGRPGFVRHLIAHTLFLLPLVLMASVGGPLPFLSRLVRRRGVTFTRLQGEPLAQASKRLRAWVEANTPATDKTTHTWRHALEHAARADFDRIAYDSQMIELVRRHHGPGWDVLVVDAMNEVYVTGPETSLTSDTVFYMPHIDGPWSVFPGGALYRVMVAVSPNRRITTHFPMTGADPATSVAITLDDGQALAFDFNRELHYITCDLAKPQENLRINLKVHYVAYPRGLRPWGRLLAWLTSRYNEQARALFLFTITPTTRWQRAWALYVLATTRAFQGLARRVGAGNLAYTGVVAGISLAAWSPLPWLVGVSFVHYLMYIATFRDRDDVAFGTFVRDAVFFKTLSMASLAACYLSVLEVRPLSLALIVGGFGLSAVSAQALGFVRTYFGVELGLVAPWRVAAWPYGWLPHPMILGSVIGLVGVGLSPGLSTWPWLVPAHVALYLVHLAQEVSDRRAPRAEAT